jgi:23S rRNA pseudouridine1911/1915/1917 synthase
METSIDDELESSELEQEFFEHLKISADKGQELLRVDKFLMNRVQNATRTKIQAAIEAGNVLVNGKQVKSNYRVKPLDEISVVYAHPPRDKEIIAENIPINIVYEDENIVVVNKHAGMVVHPGYGNYSGTLVNALMYHFQHLPLFQKNQPRPGLVHRLDKDTSGIMVLAKDEYAMAFLAKQFYERTTQRTYIAIVWGNVKDDQGTVTGNLGRNPKDRMQMTVFEDGSSGKHAVTHYKVLKRWKYLTMVECKLETGRTHQIRAHFRWIGHPLFNDELYGGSKILKGQSTGTYKKFIENCFEICPRHALHAKTLGFIHPISHEKLQFDSEIPSDMKLLIEKLDSAT